MRRWTALSVIIALTACGGSERAPVSESARGEVTRPADTGMAGMDHSKMPGMSPDTAAPMAGMDHSKMPGMGAKTAPTDAMAGMDHSKMPGMGAKTARDNPNTMAGMDHSNMAGMSGAATGPTTSAADAKLDRLVASLLDDPIVRERIRNDTALRRRWDDAARRTLLPSRP